MSANKIRGGERSGPFVLFDSKDNVIVLSAYSNFMAHYTMYNSSNGQMSFGIMGGATSVPTGYEVLNNTIRITTKYCTW